MNKISEFDRNQFEQLLADHQQLIELINALELKLYSLGEASEKSPIQECQQAGGLLISRLRSLLFRWDQEVLPLLDVFATPRPAPSVLRTSHK